MSDLDIDNIDIPEHAAGIRQIQLAQLLTRWRDQAEACPALGQAADTLTAVLHPAGFCPHGCPSRLDFDDPRPHCTVRTVCPCCLGADWIPAGERPLPCPDCTRPLVTVYHLEPPQRGPR